MAYNRQLAREVDDAMHTTRWGVQLDSPGTSSATSAAKSRKAICGWGTMDFGLQRAEREGKMKGFVRGALGLLLGGVGMFSSPGVQSSEPIRFWEDYEKQIRSRSAISAYGPDLFGDEVDLYTTALSFRHADISIPGNNALPVTLTRTLSISAKSHDLRDRPFADWELDIPRLSGVFSTDWPELRCSQQHTPPSISASATTGEGNPWEAHIYPMSFSPGDYWQGNQAHMPGGGEMLMATASTPMPATGGPYKWLTGSFVYFSCLPSIANGSGEGFLAIGPDGTKYWFNWMAQYYEPPSEKSRLLVPGSAENETADWVSIAATISRKRNVLYATRVEDRFGNWVTYSYSNAANQPAKLDRILASDGRQITLTYNGGYVRTASDGERTWSYEYANASLTGVVLPDTRRWSLDMNALSSAEVHYDGDLPQKQCGALIVYIDGGGVGRMTHPSGAVGEFEVAPVQQGRSNVPRICNNYTQPTNHPGDDVAVFSRDYVLLGVKRKKITGPGLAPMEWLYDSGSIGSWIEGSGPYCETSDCAAPQCLSDACAGSSKTIVTGPGGDWTRHTFGNSYRYNEGKLLKVERGTSSTNVLRTETTTYELAQSGQPFPTPIGDSPQARGDGFTSEYLRPMRARAIVQDGSTFSSTTNSFDQFARPLNVTATGSSTRTDATVYHDDLSKWVLGQVASVTNTNTNVVASKVDYDSNAMRWKVYGAGTTSTPGKLQYTLAYDTTATPESGQLGTLSSVTDGRTNVTVLSGWKRGTPQSIKHPATPESPGGAVESAVVNNDGTLDSVTDENGYKTCYDYDDMGRLERITYPSATMPGVCDTSEWALTTQTFSPVVDPEYGIPGGHWKQTISTGNGRKVTYFDALWRPLVEESYDSGNAASTRSIIVKRYDAGGRLEFQSFPLSSVANYADVTHLGAHTIYDVLDRVTKISQDSELGPLVTSTKYLSGFRREVTNPRQVVSVESFQTFDTPSYDAPTQVDQAVQTTDAIRTGIVRDVFGKPSDLGRESGQ